jgi:hypothetical protein
VFGMTNATRFILRTSIQARLYEIPEVVSSKDPLFERLTGLNQATLQKNWDAGGILTSCNSFAGKIALSIGVPGTSVLAKGYLNISLAQKEVPGCWQEANTADACLDNITPEAGDFYSGWITYKDGKTGKDVMQKWGHVGIVYEYEEDTGNWWLIQGGQGGPRAGVDYIKWKYTKFDRTKINGWVNIAKYLMPNED